MQVILLFLFIIGFVAVVIRMIEGKNAFRAPVKPIVPIKKVHNPKGNKKNKR